MLKKFFKIFITLIAFYVISLTIVYTVTPNILIKHTNNGLEQIEKETLYPKYFFNNNNATILDNFTDKVMLNEVIAKKDADNPLEQAMYMNGYSRYWHGYQILLRPLLVLFNYFEIRYLNTFILFALFFKVMQTLNNKINASAAWSFFTAVMCTKFFIVPMSLQFTNMIMLMLVSILLADKIFCNTPKNLFDSKSADTNNLYIFTFILGSITVFLDLLTTPILPVGMAIIFIFLHYYQKSKLFIPNKTIIYAFIAWTAGYVSTWASKWILATIICQQNIIAQALHQVLFRVAGDGAKYEVHRLSMLESNIKMLFQPFGHTPKVIIISLIVITCIILIRYFRKNDINKDLTKKLLLFSLLPYLWYLMAANHSQIHSWFTYRSQIITVFGFVYLISYIIDWTKIKSALKGKFKCLK